MKLALAYVLVGNKTVYLNWTLPFERVDGYDIIVEKKTVAAPGGFAALLNPRHPILFLHGAGGRERGPFKHTINFMESALGWTDDGHLLHDKDIHGT